MRYILRKVAFMILFLGALLILFAANLQINGNQLLSIVRGTRITSVDDIRSIISDLEDAMNDGFTGRMGFVESYSMAAKVLGKKEFSDFLYVKDESDYLHSTSFYSGPDPEMLSYAMRLKIMEEKVAEKGTKILFVLPPIKYRTGETVMDYGLPAANPENKISELMNAMTELGVDVIDFNSYFPNQTMPYNQCFYRTEKYWTIPAAWMAAREIANWMEKTNDISLDPDGSLMGPSAFEWVNYPNKMLGTQGLKTGSNYIGLEDFTALWPKDAGLYEYLCYLENGERDIIRGDIYETLIDRTVVTNLGDIPEVSAYTAYLPGQYLHNIITNRNNFTGISVFMIRDSYFSPVTVFLAPLCGTIDTIWSDNEQTIYQVEDYIENQTFDFIIMEIDPYNIGANAFDFYQEEAEKRIEQMELLKN